MGATRLQRRRVGLWPFLPLGEEPRLVATPVWIVLARLDLGCTVTRAVFATLTRFSMAHDDSLSAKPPLPAGYPIEPTHATNRQSTIDKQACDDRGK